MSNILIVCNYREGVGGISGQAYLLLTHLRTDGHTATLFSTRGTVWHRIGMPFQLLRAARRADIVHIHCCSHWGFLPALAGVPIGRMLHRHVVVTYHGGGAEAFFSRHHKLVSSILRRADYNIVLNGFLKGIFNKHGIPSTIVPNIIEPTVYTLRKRDILQPHYICTRAHEPLYRIEWVLQAFAEVLRRQPEATLTLLGTGSSHEALVRLAHSLGIDRRVKFTGRVNNSEVRVWLAKADIFLSAAAEDNMPVSVMEAMQQGLLVVASRVGGVPYLIDDSRTGLLFDTEEQLSTLMLEAVEHQERTLNIIEQALCEVKKYSWPNIAPLIYRTYGFPA